MERAIYRLYHILLADQANDPDYAEGNVVGGFRVYGSASEMKNRLSGALGKQPIPLASGHLGNTPLWHVDDCTVRYQVDNDTELPNNPTVFGLVSVIGSKTNVDKVNARLTESIPGIDDLFNDCEY
ncbi:MAG: hypothetical protein ABH879_02760 [archaeon]